MARAPDPDTVAISKQGVLPDIWDPLILSVDKPAGWTSFDVIRKLRPLSPIRKMGHAGTLDPMATGLLIILSGKATRLMNHFLAQDKEYEATIRLGQTTASWDADTEVLEEADASTVTDEMIAEAIPDFSGDIIQTTPAYSAAKVEGERLYKKARRGEHLTLPSRSVTVHSFEVLGRQGRDVDVRITCSSGTYIRSLAHELGAQLGVGGHLVRLRRTRIGSLEASDSWKMQELVQELRQRREEIGT